MDNTNKNMSIMLLLFFTILIIVAVLFLLRSGEDEALEESPSIKQVQQDENRRYSRVTFFNAKEEQQSSLAIPEDWEGKYRVLENGQVVTFNYVVSPVKSFEIFSVTFVSPGGHIGVDYTEIGEKSGMKVYYRLGSNNVDVEIEEDFKRIQSEVENIVKSLR